MEYRTLGRTGLKVSEIGFGAWGIGGVQWLDGSDDESRRALNEAIDLGVGPMRSRRGALARAAREVAGRVVLGDGLAA